MTSTDAGSAAALGAAGWRNGSARRTAPSGGRTRAGRTRSAPPSGRAAPEVARRARDLPWDAAPNASKRKRRYCPIDKPDSQSRGTGARTVRGSHRRYRRKSRAGEMTVGDGNASTDAGSAAALGAAGWRHGSARRTAPSGGRTRSERTRSAPPSGRRSRGGCGTCHGTQYRMLRSANAGIAHRLARPSCVEAPGVSMLRLSP